MKLFIISVVIYIYGFYHGRYGYNYINEREVKENETK